MKTLVPNRVPYREDDDIFNQCCFNSGVGVECGYISRSQDSF